LAGQRNDFLPSDAGRTAPVLSLGG